MLHSPWALAGALSLLVASQLVSHEFQLTCIAISGIVIALILTARLFFEQEIDSLHNQIINLLLEEADASSVEFGTDLSSQGLSRIHQAMLWSFEWQKKKHNQIEYELRGILSTISDGIIVVNPEGIVTLVNQAAIYIAGIPIQTNTSVFNMFWRSSLAEALEQEDNNHVELKTLEDKILEGKVIKLQDSIGYVIHLKNKKGTLASHESQIDYLPLVHDIAQVPTVETTIEKLPLVVIDTETTGLRTHSDAVVSFAGVYCVGAHHVLAQRMEQLIQPDTEMRSESIRIHGILPKNLVGKPSLATAWQPIRDFLGQRVIVGHHIGFDLQILVQNLARQNVDWQPSLFIDTQLLARSLYPKIEDDSLDGLLSWFGVNDLGRHTALGDALMTAKVASRLLIEAMQKGDTTLNDILIRQASQTSLIAEQKKHGWFTPQDMR